MTRHYPDLGSASDWFNQISRAARPIRSTTQIWVVTCHQYGISALVSQTSFGVETSVSVAKCRLFSQANGRTDCNLKLAYPFQVSYIKAIDSYLIVSFIFVFGVLLEYVAVLMHSERKKAKARGKRSTSKDYSMAEMEIETFHTKDSEVVPRSHSSYSLPPRPKSAHGFPPLSPSSYSLPQKSALRNSYPRQVKVS